MKRIGFVLVVLMLAVSACVPVEKTVEVTKVIPTLTVIGPWAGAEMDQFLPVLKAAEKKLGV